MSFVDAASMALAFDTAWFALCERGRAKAGETVLVLGATGAVGHAAVQLAKAYGLRVLAGISDRTREALVLDAGADHIIDLSVPDLRDSLREQVHQVTGGAGGNIVLDQLGGDYFDAAVRAVAWRGRVVVVGFAAGRIPTLKVNYVLLKNMEVSGMQVSDYRKRAPDEMAHCMSEIFRLYNENKIRAAPSVTYPLREAPQALAALSNRSHKARIVLTSDQAR